MLQLTPPPIRTTLAIGVLITTLHPTFYPDSMCFVRQQLFFTCTVRPLNATRGGYNSYLEDMALDLVFFSASEESRLRTSGTMESIGIRKLYEPSPVPTLYVGRVEDLLGRAPLFPCFLMETPQLPFRTSTLQARSRPSNLGALTVRRARDHAGICL